MRGPWGETACVDTSEGEISSSNDHWVGISRIMVYLHTHSKGISPQDGSYPTSDVNMSRWSGRLDTALAGFNNDRFLAGLTQNHSLWCTTSPHVQRNSW